MNEQEQNQTEFEMPERLSDLEKELPSTTEETIEQEEKVVEEFKPWKKEQVEKKEVESIPYSRFKEVNDERKVYQSKLEEYERELSELRQAKEKIEKIKGPEDINIADYDDVDSYMKDVIAATKRSAISEVERNYQEREIKRVQEAKNAEITNNFQKNVERAIEKNPEIKEAVSFIDQYADQLDPRIAKELLLDENAGEVIYSLVTNPDNLTKLFKSEPEDVIRMIHKMSAKFDLDMTDKKDSGNTKDVPKALVVENKQAIRDMLPKTIKSNVSVEKNPAKMSQAEFTKWVNNGYK